MTTEHPSHRKTRCPEPTWSLEPGTGEVRHLPPIKRSSIRKDILCFGLPFFTVFVLEVNYCGPPLSRLWGTIWDIITQPQILPLLPGRTVIGLALFVVGLGIMIAGQLTLWYSYSATVLIREGHELVTHGIYRFTRNPMYLGLIAVVISLPVYAASLRGFLASLVLIPIIMNRIRMEEKLLEAEYGERYLLYKKGTKRLIPYLY